MGPLEKAAVLKLCRGLKNPFKRQLSPDFVGVSGLRMYSRFGADHPDGPLRVLQVVPHLAQV